MKLLMTSTAIAAFLAAPALAQTASETEIETGVFVATGDSAAIKADLRASELIGQRIYTSEAPPSEEDGVLEISDTWEDIGEVNDVILSADGSVEAILIDVGGFLGIGERTVAIRADQLQFVNDADDDGDYFLVVNAPRALVEEAPEYDLTQIGTWTAATVEKTAADAMQATEEAAEAMAESAENVAAETEEAVETAAAETEAAVDEAAAETEAMAENAAAETEEAVETAAAETEEAVDTAAAETEAAVDEAAAEAETVATEISEDMEKPVAPQLEIDGYTVAKMDDLTTEELTGARLYDTNDELIGEVSKLLLDDQGNLTKAVLDVGGFLGLGEHSVAMEMDRLQIQRSDADGGLRVYVDATEEELESLPEYDEQG